MKTEDDAVRAADATHPEAKEGSDIATAPAAALGTAEPAPAAPGERLSAQLPGDTPEAKIDALHAKHFAGTAIASDTAAWNQVHAFVQDIKRLWSEIEATVEKL